MPGILGGTFDPIHYGHLRPAFEAARALGLGRLHVIPCGEPPHRAAPRTAAVHRLEMARIACAGEPLFHVDDREIRRGGPSYTVDTLRELRGEYGAESPLCLFLGLDAFRALDGWNRWREITALAHIVVTRRPGARMPRTGPVADLLARRRVDDPAVLRAAPAGAVILLPVTRLDISATRIRAGLAAGDDPRYLLPDAVCGYIRDHGLYRP